MGKKNRKKRRTSYYITDTEQEIFDYQIHSNKYKFKQEKSNNPSLVYRNDSPRTSNSKSKKHYNRFVSSKQVDTIFLEIFSTNYYLVASDSSDNSLE